MAFIRKILAIAFLFGAIAAASAQTPAWSQWGQNPQHTGNMPVAGQAPQAKLSDLVFDPFVSAEVAESSALLMHYQAPLISGATVFMEFKSGTYVSCNPPKSGQPFPCGPDAWNTEIWNETALQWQNGQLTPIWNFASDWTPPPNSGTAPTKISLGGWEPVFQPTLAGAFIYVPGAGGTVYQLNQSDGSVVMQINPFGGGIDPSKFVAGGLTADDFGNIYYNVIQVNLAWPWNVDVTNSWLVKVAPDGSTSTVTYTSLLPNAPQQCLGTFAGQPLPWPPSLTAQPPNISCGSQRSALNVAPAISSDGSTVYTVSRGHFWPRSTYLLAVNSSDLNLQWSTGLNEIFDDGCNILLPADGLPDGCSIFGTTGFDPTQNTLGSASASDEASASPVVAPDGSILFGTNAAYNYGRGHLLKFSPQGQYLASYDFGWDSTPAIFPNNGSYSVILKDNHYDNGSYCSNPTWCPAAPPGPYYVTQLDSDLNIQWQFQDTTVAKNHPNGYEWCANDAAVDVNGVVYALNEDGHLYVIPQSATGVQSVLLEKSEDAGYTPVTMGPDGMVYALNAGHLVAVGQLFATSTQLSSSANPSIYGTAVTFTATVTSTGGTPPGVVTFKRGTTAMGKGTLISGTASYTTKPTQLPAGTSSITAAYAGDAKDASSTSVALTQVVNQAATTTVLTSQPNPSTAGQSVTLTATVTATPGVPTGTVTFKSGSRLLGRATLTNGVATLNTVFSKPGSLSLTASYAGTANYQSSTGSVTQTVQ
ncbi:MAG: Ig-like domain-containing protein [Candidatus Sulfotelmatobacter sp.]